jgi:hypothetical protein
MRYPIPVVRLLALLLLSTAAWAAAGNAPPADHAARVESFSPQGYVRHVRQVVVRFGDSMVALGDPRLADPFTVSCPAHGHNPDVRFVPIKLPDGRLVTATIDAVRDHSYPLYDNMWIYATRRSDGSIPPKVAEFLRFILSRQAQQEVNLDTTMLPLTRALLVEERGKLH